MTETKPETIEAEVPEVLPDTIETQADGREDELTIDGMDAVIAVAEKMPAFSKAMDVIINAIIKRSYPGDWVVHAKETDPEEKKKANIGAAAAERIAVFLGIQEKSWTKGVKEWSDDRRHYTWIFEADFGFKNRWVHAIGKAGTRDKFYSVVDGKMKPLEDIQEDHIKTNAFRAARKEGVRLLLGLRSIPVSKLIELGYDKTQIRYASFADKGKQLDESAKTVNKETGLAEREIVPMEIVPTEKASTDGKTTYRRLAIRDTDMTIWTMWSEPGGKGRREAILKDALSMKEKVKVSFKTEQYRGADQYTIEKVNGIGNS